MVNLIRFMCVVLCLCASGDVMAEKVSGTFGKRIGKGIEGTQRDPAG